MLAIQQRANEFPPRSKEVVVSHDSEAVIHEGSNHELAYEERLVEMQI
jgi:hypothetical protein